MKQYPANPIQAAAYHRYVASPGAPGAQTQVSISFGESVNADFLRHAWQVVIQRHPILRSAFSKTIDGITIREADKAEPHWISLDWQNIPEAEIPEKWNALVASDAKATFEPVSLPLVRIHEIKLPGGAGHHLLTTPAFLLDEFSIARLLLDLLLSLGQTPLAPAGDPPVILKAKSWREFLEGAASPMRLNPRPGPCSQVRSSVLLDRTKTSEFTKFCHDNDLEESLVVRCLWSLVLRRFGSAGNLLLCRFDGRGESTEAGYFQNWLPMVQSWEGNVGDWLDAAQLLEDTIAENIWVDPSEAMRSVGLDFSPEEIPASFVWRGPSINDIVHTALPRWINFDAQIQPASSVGLRLEACPGPRLELSLRGAFPSDVVAKEMLSRLAHLISSLAESCQKPVRRLTVLLPEEIRVLREESRGRSLPAESHSVVEAFKKTAARNAEAVAVRFGGQDTTYADLDALSDKLAAHLETSGVDGGWHVAILMAPSSWIAIALLGVWKAGNSCLALDPTASPEWIEQTLAAHDASVVICDSATAERIDPGQRRRIVIDQDLESAPQETPKARRIAADDLAASIPGHVDSASPLVRALTHSMLLTAAIEGARLMDFHAGDSFLVRSMPGGGSFFDEWLLPLLAGG
ncbi:MAG: AMP-binding protein, partial [Verrucomicrobiota bacterium]